MSSNPIKLSTRGLGSHKKLFHNLWIRVYETELPLEKVTFWKENNRTLFTLERLAQEKRKAISEIPTDEITRFVAKQDIHKLSALAASIRRNGVQVPLVIRDDGRLLDGNRRYFACRLLRMQCEGRGERAPEVLAKIPVWIIREKDLSQEAELKILAEANFVPDLKVPWPLDAQARAVNGYYEQIRAAKQLDHESALLEVIQVFGIARSRATDLMDTLVLSDEFIQRGSSAREKTRRRSIVEGKFVYLWEFRNKATKGRIALSGSELADVKRMFFGFMAAEPENPIGNVKEIEPLVRARRDPTAWTMLTESKGAKLKVVVAHMKERKEERRAEDKIRLFTAWLEEVGGLTRQAESRLRALVKAASRKLKG